MSPTVELLQESLDTALPELTSEPRTAELLWHALRLRDVRDCERALDRATEQLRTIMSLVDDNPLLSQSQCLDFVHELAIQLPAELRLSSRAWPELDDIVLTAASAVHLLAAIPRHVPREQLKNHLAALEQRLECLRREMDSETELTVGSLDRYSRLLRDSLAETASYLNNLRTDFAERHDTDELWDRLKGILERFQLDSERVLRATRDVGAQQVKERLAEAARSIKSLRSELAEVIQRSELDFGLELKNLAELCCERLDGLHEKLGELRAEVEATFRHALSGSLLETGKPACQSMARGPG